MVFGSFPGRAEPLGKKSSKVSDVFTVDMESFHNLQDHPLLECKGKES